MHGTLQWPRWARVAAGIRRNPQDMLEGFMPTSRNRKINMKMKFALRDVL